MNTVLKLLVPVLALVVSFHTHGQNTYVDPPKVTLNRDNDKNWISSSSHNFSGEFIYASMDHYNTLGLHIQHQNLSTIRETSPFWGYSTYYDAIGRPSLTTLPTALFDLMRQTSNNLFFIGHFDKDHFIYTNALGDYESNNEVIGTSRFQPSKVNSQSHIGAAYSDYSHISPFQDITDYPFTRTVYSNLIPGKVLAQLGGNKVDGEWPQTYSFSMPASNELSSAYAFNNTAYNSIKTFKTVSRDPHGVESVIFKDSDGNTLAAARSGNQEKNNLPKYKVTLSINEQGHVDVHIPVGCSGITASTIPQNVSLEIYDLVKDKQVYYNLASIPAGIYRIAVNNTFTYNKSNTTITLQHDVNYFDYNLNTFDKTGRLLKSTQPKSKTMASTFKYNSFGQLLETTSPDEGLAKFKYRKDGQIRFSQNVEQAKVNNVSFTNYDKLGRPIKSGIFQHNDFNSLNPDDYIVADYQVTEGNYTVYDISEKDLGLLTRPCGLGHTKQRFVSGNVAKTYNDYSTTWYSYDAYGRVEWILQDIQGLDCIKSIDYTYHFNSGQIASVIYQKDVSSEYFEHKYEYDNQGNLITVKTSTNGIDYITNAEYTYNSHSLGDRLERLTLEEDLQTIDYVYNLNGQLKAINHPSLNPSIDPTTQSNDPNDIFGMTLFYNNQDYLKNTTYSSGLGENQKNGNIKGIEWQTQGDAKSSKYYFNYNRNNWLTKAQMNDSDALEHLVINTPVGNQTSEAAVSITLKDGFHAPEGVNYLAHIKANPLTDYKVDNITYDANGNILTLNRNKNVENNSNAMDDLTYKYDANTNRLLQVQDNVTTNTNADDIKHQNDPNNYVFNDIGQLIENKQDNVTYTYNTSGLVTQVLKNGQPLVDFTYNERGQRIQKTVNHGIFISSTNYVRDAAGKPIAIYTSTSSSPILSEHPIYGASRLGILRRNSDNTNNNGYFYQITDHLGNVRAVITRSNFGNIASTVGKTDYYPFGMPMPNRNLQGNYRYAFQGQEKDSETGKEAFQLRLWDSRIGRWLTTDPYGQYHSPYLGMGNDPINGIDPDGGFKWKWWAKTVNFLVGGDGVKHDPNRNEWYVKKISYTYENKSVTFEGKEHSYQQEGILFNHIYKNPEFYVEGDVGLSVGAQIGVDVKAFGARVGASGHYNRLKTNVLGAGFSNEQGLYNTSNIGDYSYDKLSSGYSGGIGLIGGGAEYYPEGNLIPSQYNGQMKSENISFPVFGSLEKQYDLTGMQNENTLTNKSWGLGADVKIIMFGVHGNLNFGYKY